MMKTKRDKACAAFADKQIDRAVYNALYDVYVNGAYCARALTDALKTVKSEARPFVTSAFYGVLDKNVRFDKIIAALCEKAPDKSATVILKIGLFYLRYADMPDYAAVDRSVELSKAIGGVFGGFINAVLKKSIGYEPTFSSELEKFSYDHNTPEWLCKALISDYSEAHADSVLSAVLPDKTHIRPVKNRITQEQFVALAKRTGSELTEYGCYCDKAALASFESGTYAVQSLSSVKAVRAYVKDISKGKVLDLCAAPGGKSVYMSELGDFRITSCDIYEHKLDLMRGYAKKLGARLTVKLNDATRSNPDFIKAFDLVVADCPCSGTGTLKAKPDIMLRRKPSDLNELCGIQSRILDVSADYCKDGGVLCYSTCSMLKCENADMAKRFLSKHKDFALIDSVELFPDTDNCDGFYIARFKKVGKA